MQRSCSNTEKLCQQYNLRISCLLLYLRKINLRKIGLKKKE